MARKFEITNKETKYESPWLVVKEFSILRDGEPGSYSVVERKDAAIVAASSSDGQILFEKQYRFPTDGEGWELPMGAIEYGEQPSEAAQRELHEETGLDTPVQLVGSFRPLPGLTPQHAFVFRSSIPDSALEDLKKFNQPADEILDRRLLSLEEIKLMVASGEISDGFTLSSLCLLQI